MPDENDGVLDRVASAARGFRRNREQGAAKRQKRAKERREEFERRRQQFSQAADDIRQGIRASPLGVQRSNDDDDGGDDDGESVSDFIGKFVDTDGDGEAEAQVALSPLGDPSDSAGGRADDGFDSALSPLGPQPGAGDGDGRDTGNGGVPSANSTDFEPLVDAAADAFDDGRVDISVRVENRRTEQRNPALSPLEDQGVDKALEPFPMEDRE